jgi:hypothetical protein
MIRAIQAYVDMFTSVVRLALRRSPVLLVLALLLSAHARADTYKTEKECLRDLDAVKARVQKWYQRRQGEQVEKPSQSDFELELQFAENKQLCAIGYIDHVGLHTQWPEGEDAYSKEVLNGLKEWTVQQLQKLPDLPVFGSRSEEPPSFAEWRRQRIKETGETVRGVIFRCFSWVAGKATGGGIKTALRAHHLECNVTGWRSERLALVTDDDFGAQFKLAMQSLVDSFVERYEQVRGR